MELNQYQSEKIRQAVINIPHHLFGHHQNCGEWCQNESDKENVPGPSLKNKVLFENLKGLFQKICENSDSYAACASSQANESLNNSMASKAPKRITYCLLKSSDFQFVCAVAEKNLGIKCTENVLKHNNMRVSKSLVNFNQQMDKIKKKREEIAGTTTFKRRRLFFRLKEAS